MLPYLVDLKKEFCLAFASRDGLLDIDALLQVARFYLYLARRNVKYASRTIQKGVIHIHASHVPVITIRFPCKLAIPLGCSRLGN